MLWRSRSNFAMNAHLDQCCGSKIFWDSDTDPQIFNVKICLRIRILRVIFWPEIFIKSASHCSHIFWKLCDRKQMFAIEKSMFCLCFQVFNILFFNNNFCIQKQCLYPNPYLNLIFFWFWFGSGKIHRWASAPRKLTPASALRHPSFQSGTGPKKCRTGLF
jgi:hypothetical protein